MKNVGPIHHCELPHADSADVASGTVARRLHINVHDNADDNARQRGPLWLHGMGPITGTAPDVNANSRPLQVFTVSRYFKLFHGKLTEAQYMFI